jgi:hypothetical protein
MRRHGRFAALAPAIDGALFHELAHPQLLICARLDPGISGRFEGWLDLVFSDGERFLLVPYIVIQGLMIATRESSPFVWPGWLPPMRDALARDLEDLLEPWLRSLVVARFHSEEVLRFFTDDAPLRDAVARAREHGFLGAAPSERVMSELAPYVYARRFSDGANIGIVDVAGSSGAALLARSAASVRADLGDPERNALAQRWYGRAIYGDVDRGSVWDVVVGPRGAFANPPKASIVLDDVPAGGERTIEVATPIVPSVCVSFDRTDGDPVRAFAVAAPSPIARLSALPAMKIVGGSSGRIAVVVRDDAVRADDADVDAANAMVERLREQGFDAQRILASRLDPAAHDLIHVFGHRHAAALGPALEEVRRRRLPLVVTPFLDDPAAESAWGAGIAQLTLRITSDEMSRRRYATAVAARRLDAPGVPARGTAVDAETRALLMTAGAAVVSSPDEERLLRERLGFTGGVHITPALLGDEPACEPVGALVGSRDFALLHAPIDPRCNQYAVVQAARAARVPLVLTGSVSNAEYYTELMQALDDGAIWLPAESLSPGELAGLYARARLYIDAGWSGNGLYRCARAAGYGAGLVASTSGFAGVTWPGLVETADPGSIDALTAALTRAWERAPESGPALAARTAERCDPFTALVVVLAAYGKAAAAPAV